MSDALKQQNLSRRERQIMDALYEGRELTAQQVREAMPSPPGYSAVRATLAKLLEKGVVSYRQDGPRYVYAPALAHQSASQSALQRMLKTFFAGSRAKAVNALLGMPQEPLSDLEIDELQALIDNARNAKKTGQ